MNSKDSKTQKKLNSKKVSTGNEDLVQNPKDDFARADQALLGALEFERALCLDKHETSKSIGDSDVLISDNRVKIKTLKVDPEKCFPVTLNAIKQLYKDSSMLRAHPSDILALKVILGANEDNTMHVFYQPICLSLINEIVDAELQNQGIFNVTESLTTYDYNYVDKNSIFQPAPAGVHKKYYQDFVSIFHNETEKWGPFSPGKDVESVIFTFQEIFNFMYNNKLQLVKIFNCIRRFNTIDKKYINKHSLILSEYGPYGANVPGVSKKTKKVSAYVGKYSNLTHLCPPNCARLMHPLERKEF